MPSQEQGPAKSWPTIPLLKKKIHVYIPVGRHGWSRAEISGEGAVGTRPAQRTWQCSGEGASLRRYGAYVESTSDTNLDAYKLCAGMIGSSRRCVREIYYVCTLLCGARYQILIMSLLIPLAICSANRFLLQYMYHIAKPLGGGSSAVDGLRVGAALSARVLTVGMLPAVEMLLALYTSVNSLYYNTYLYVNGGPGQRTARPRHLPPAVAPVYMCYSPFSSGQSHHVGK